MSTQATDPNAADRPTGDAAALLPTATTTTGPADRVTAREIAEFLRQLARFRSPAAGGDRAEHAALLARKTELFARIADQHARAATGPPPPTAPTAPEGLTS
ncbi:MAG: hypothetical protein L0I76_36540 [Pseudonocardia sp.]|nr:hypothetical protein [Pseudonocardia sp.]